MRNSLYTVGILLTACFLIITALILTWLEINEYEHGVAEAQLPPPSAPAAETPEGSGEGGEAPAQDRFLSLAPSDAMAIAVVDVKRLRDSGAMEQATPLKDMAGPQAGPFDPESADRVTFFASPNPAGPDQKPITTGAVLISTPMDQVRQSLQQAAESTSTVAGLEAYKVKEYYGALVGDDMLLFGDSTDSLSGIIERNESGGGGAPADLTDSLGRYSDAMMRFVAVLPASMKQQLTAQMPPEAPESLKEINRLGGGLDFEGQQLSLNTRISFDSADAASSLAEVANQKLDEFKSKAAQMIEQMGEGAGQQQRQAMEAARSILDSVRISASGQDLEVDVQIDVETIGQAMGFLMMQAMSGMQGMGPGGPGGPPRGPGGN
jgi:hypothetical protein